jgi:acyltransferase
MLVFATGGALFGYAITNEYGNLGAWWTFGIYGFWGGLLRVMFASLQVCCFRAYFVSER